MQFQRRGSAVWQGGLKDGQGKVSVESGLFRDGAYGFSTRFENHKGTNPEELIAAAHAACFSMALSGELGKAGLNPQSLQTEAAVTIDQQATGWTVTESHLKVTAQIPGADQAKFEAAAQQAKAGCPISRLLNCNITLETRLGAMK
jgi:osmotically inducible protein OsmC